MATPIGQNKDGSLIYEQNMSVAPKVPQSTFKPITPVSTGIPGVGVPEVPGLQPIVPQTLIDKSQPEIVDKTPEAFKSLIVKKFPTGVTNDGRKYADLDPYEITDMIVKKFPDGVTNAGTPYKDYLQAPKNRREAFMASGANKTYKIDENKFISFIRDITSPYRGVKTAMESGSIGLQSVIADGMDLVGMDTTAQNLRNQLTADKQTLGEEMKGDKGLIGGIQAGDPASVASALFSGVTSLLIAGNLPGAVALGASTAGNISLEGEEQQQNTAGDKAFAYGAGTVSALLDRLSAGKILDGLLAKGVKPSVANGIVKKTEGFLKSLKPSDFEVGTEILQQRIEDWGRDLMGVEYDRNWKDYAEAGLMGKILGKVGDSDTQTLNDAMSKKTTVKDKLTRTIPEKTVSNYLSLTPTERSNVEKILGGKTAEQYILENNLGGVPKGELTDIFQKQATDSYNGIKEQLAPITDRIESTGAKTAIDDMLETFEGLSSLEKSVYEKDINYLKQLAEQDDYTLSELHALRQAFDKVNTGMYTAKGAVRSGTRAGAEVEVRNALSNDIQENAIKNGVDVKKMNQDLRVALTLKDGLLRSLSQEAKNNLVGLQDIGIMGIFSGGEPLTALSLGIGKKFLEGQMPGVAQKLYNLNKAPYENTAVKRGNTVATGNGSRLFGLPNSMGDSDASGVPKVKPSVIVSNNPAEILAFEISNGKIDVKKAIEAIKKLSPEEIAKYPELVKLQEVQGIIDYVDETINGVDGYGVLPPEDVPSLVKVIKEGGYTPVQQKYLMDNLPKEVKAEIYKQNRIKTYGKDFTEKPAKGEAKGEGRELPKKIADIEDEIGMLDDNMGDRSSFVQKYDGTDEYGTAGDAYDAVKDMDRFEFEDYASLWKDKQGGGMIPKNETANKIINNVDAFADKLGISSDDAITLIRNGTGGSRYVENLANFRAKYGVAPFEAKKALAKFKKDWEAGKNPSIDDFLYKKDNTIDFNRKSREEMDIENSKTPFDDLPPVKETPVVETKVESTIPDDWTKEDFTTSKKVETVDTFGNTVIREPKNGVIQETINVDGQDYREIGIPDTNRALYMGPDEVVYEYKGGKMISEIPKVEFTREQATKYMNDNIDRIMKEVKSKKITGEAGKEQMLELQNDMKYLRLGITPEKLKAGKEKLLDGVMKELESSTPKVEGKTAQLDRKGNIIPESIVKKYRDLEKELSPLEDKYYTESEKYNNMLPKGSFKAPSHTPAEIAKQHKIVQDLEKEYLSLKDKKEQLGFAADDGYLKNYDEATALIDKIQSIPDRGKEVKLSVLKSELEKALKGQRNDLDEYISKYSEWLNTKPKSSLPMSQKESVKYSKPVEDTLIQEARKYKSAEEFVKAQGKTDYRDYLKKNIPEIEDISKEGVITLKDGTKGELIVGKDYDIPEISSFNLDKKGTGLGTKIIDGLKEWAVLQNGGQATIGIKRNVNSGFWSKVGFKGDKFQPGESGWKWNSRTQPGLFDKKKQQLLDIYNKANKK